jgi:hypothetical protein
MALNLVIAAITFWNTIYIDKAASHLAQTSPLYDVKLLPHTSPLGWEHVILSGDFDWHSLYRMRPSRVRPTAIATPNKMQTSAMAIACHITWGAEPF